MEENTTIVAQSQRRQFSRDVRLRVSALGRQKKCSIKTILNIRKENKTLSKWIKAATLAA